MVKNRLKKSLFFCAYISTHYKLFFKKVQNYFASPKIRSTFAPQNKRKSNKLNRLCYRLDGQQYEESKNT